MAEIQRQMTKKTKENVGHAILDGTLKASRRKLSSLTTVNYSPSESQKLRRVFTDHRPDRCAAVKGTKRVVESKSHCMKGQDRRSHAERRTVYTYGILIRS